MALNKTVLWKGEWLENGTVQAIKVTTISEEGEDDIIRIKRGNIIVPGVDYSGEDKTIRQVCKALHTPEVIAAYQASRIEEL
jgi:hypothetical protein